MQLTELGDRCIEIYNGKLLVLIRLPERHPCSYTNLGSHYGFMHGCVCRCPSFVNSLQVCNVTYTDWWRS
jgi:hypothetical protein